MRGADISQPSMFVMKTVSDYVPKTHPLRDLRELMNEALNELNWLFDSIYADGGRESVPPEWLLRASLLQVLYTIRSERQLVEHIHYNMLFRWFVGLEAEDEVWDHSTFSKNRDRLLDHDLIPQLFEAVLELARKRKLLSEDHFSVDGTLIKAWASHKSFRPKDDDEGGPLGKERDYRGERRKNDTHASSTDPDAQMMRKSNNVGAELSYGVHHVMENRHGLVVAIKTTSSASVTEREAGLDLLSNLPGSNHKTVGADKGYDTKDFVHGCRDLGITAHVARNDRRRGGSAIDGRTARHAGYAISQRHRKRIETTFGWAKHYGGLRHMMRRGLQRVGDRVLLTMTGFNLLRIRNIETQGV